MVFCCNRVTDSDGTPPGRKNGLVQKSDRKCRDVLCLLFFIVYWVGMIVVAFIGMKTGKPLSLVYGRDYNGSVCGDGIYATRKFTAYPRLNDDMITAVENHIPLNKMPLFGVCVDSCPLTGSYVCTYDNQTCWLTTMDTTAVLFRCLPMDHQNETIISQECLDPPTADPTCTLDLYLQKKCSLVCKTKRVQKNVWDVEATTPNPLMDQLQGHLATLGRFVSDTHASSKLILIVGGGGAMLLGIIWLIILQFFAGCMIWLTCWLVVLVLLVMSLFCSVKSGLITIAALSNVSFLKSAATSANVSLNVNAYSLQSAGDQSSRMQFEVAAYVMWVLTAVVVLLLIAMRKRIHVAIAIVREASTAIKRLPLLLLWPLVPTVLFILLTVYAMAIAAYLLSSNDLTSVVESTAALAAQAANNISNSTTLDGVNDKVKALPSNKIQQLLLGFHLFGFLWTNQLIQAISITTIAGSIAQYYWTAPDGNNKRNLEARFPIVRALRNVLRFSLGSLCFGSFIIALVQFARIILEYIDRQTKQLQNSNAFVKIAFLAVRCCLWCFEKCLKFLSKNAYIIIAMRGTSFCSASFDAFKLIFKNLARVAVVNSISFFLLFLVKVTITLAVGSAVFVILGSASTSTQLAVLDTHPVTSPMAPVLISCVLAWLVASAFTNIYDAAIDTILLCFCEDIELNGEGASDFMSDELRRIMGDTGGKRREIQGESASPGPDGEQHGSPNSNNKVYIDNNI